MAAIPVIYGDSSWLRLAKAATSQFIKDDFDKAVKVNPTFTGAATASETEAKYHTTDGANGNQYSVSNSGTNYNVTSGDTISSDTAAANYGKFDCEVFYTAAQYASLVEAYAAGTAFVAIREIGKSSATQLPAGYEFLAGVIADLKLDHASGPAKAAFSISGKPVSSTFTLGADNTYTTLNTAATGAGNTITPHADGTARTIPALTSTDYDNIKLGKIVYKAATT